MIRSFGPIAESKAAARRDRVGRAADDQLLVAPRSEHHPASSRRHLTDIKRLMNAMQPLVPHHVSFNGVRPLALTKRQVATALGSTKLVTRMLWASRHTADLWLLVVRAGRDLLIDTQSVETAYQRMLRGELPPRMPCECRQSTMKVRTTRSNHLTTGKNGKLARGQARARESTAGP